MRLRISDKGLFIVCLPLAFSTIFMLLLFALLHLVNTQIEEEENARAVLARTHSFGHYIVTMTSAVAGLSLQADEQLKAKRIINYNYAMNQLREMRRLLRNEPDDLKIVESMSSTLDQINAMLTKTVSQAEAPSEDNMKLGLDVLYTDNSVQMSAQYWSSFDKGIKDLTNDQEARVNNSLQNVAQIKKIIVSVMIGGVIVSILLTVSLTLFFSRDIVSRLRLLARNAHALGLRKPLTLEVFGGDEISALNDALKETNKELDDLEAARQNLVAFVSHELKTPLTSLSTFFRLLSENAYMPLSAEGTASAISANSQLEEVRRLITDLIDIERLEGGKLQLLWSDIDVPSLVDMIARGYQNAPVKGIQLETGSVPDVLIRGDRDRLVRVLSNLIHDCASRTAENGRIDLCVTGPSAIGNQSMIVFKLSDNGSPLDAQMQQSVFQPPRDIIDRQEQALNDYLTAAVPLIVTRLIIEQHGGTLHYDRHEAGEFKNSFICQLPADTQSDEDELD